MGFSFYANAQTIYYSKADGNFSSLSTWAENSDGTGLEPTSINGNHFVILDTYTVTVTTSDIEIHSLEIAGTLEMSASSVLKISNDYYYYQTGDVVYDPSSEIIFNNSSSISVLEARNTNGSEKRLDFSNLTFDKGGNKVIINDSPLNIDGNFDINNTEFESKSYIYLSGNIDIDASSKYSTEAGNDLILDGSGDQSISVPAVTNLSASGSTVAQFSDVRFTVGGNYTISKGFYSTGTLDVYKEQGAKLEFENGDYSLRSIRVRSDVTDLGQAIKFNGGNVYLNNSSSIEHYDSNDPSAVGTIDIGTVNIFAENAGLSFGDSNSDGDNVTFTGNLTMSNGYSLTLRTNTVLNSNGGTLTINDDSRVYVRGTVTPSFGTYTISDASTFYYESTSDVTLLPIQYGNLRLYNASNKTAADDITVKGDLGVYDEANLVVSADKTVTIHENIENRSEDDAGESGTIDASAATITMVMNDVNRSISLAKDLAGGGDNIYVISKFNIEVGTALTSTRSLTISNKLDIDELTITNTSGSLSTLLIVDVRDGSTEILDISTSLTQGDFTHLRTRSATAPFLTTPTTVDIDQSNAFMEFIGTDQTIPAITYGNLELNGNGNKTLAGNVIINGRIERTGGTNFLLAGTNTMTIYGDWIYNNSAVDQHDGIDESTVIFAGTNDQVINDAAFGNLTFNTTGNVTLARPITVYGDMTLSGGTDEANLLNLTANENIDLFGNWSENATSKFSQTKGRVRFSSTSTTVNQTVTQNTGSEFNDITLNNDPSITTVFNTHVTIAGDLRMESERGDLEVNEDLILKGHFYNLGTGNDFTQAENKTLTFAGSSLQYLRVDDPLKSTFGELVAFTGEGMKQFQGVSDFTFNKGISITGTTVDGSNKIIHIKGDWLNNDGLFESTGTVNFNGEKAQTVQSTSFYRFSIQNNLTQVNLTGNISIYQLLQDAGTRLNTNGNTIICASTWTGNGTFVHGDGTVTFTGQSSTITESDPFYNLSSTLIEDETLTFNNDLVVENDFTVSLDSRVNIGNHDLTIGGDLLSDGDIYNVTTLTFNGDNATRTYQIKNGLDRGDEGTTADNNNTDIVIAPTVNATYNLMSNIRMTGSTGDLTVNSGKLDLNGFSLEQTNNNKQVIVKGNAELIVSAGSTLQLTGSDSQAALLGEALSTISFAGDDNNYALIEGYADNSYMVLINGLLSAKNYKITDLRSYGLQFGSSSSLAATPNNLTNGIFVNGLNNATASITIASGATLGTTTIENVTFGQGPANAVVNNSSDIGTITFFNAKGSNKLIEDDTPNLIEWDFDAFFTWEGGTSTDWHLAANWKETSVPTKTNNVLIPSSLTNYPVVDGATAVAKRIEILDGGSLTVEDRLEAYDGIFINTGGSVIGGTVNTDSIVVFGDWINEGTFTANSSPLRFTQEDGVSAQLISFIPGTDDYESILIDGKEHTILQSDNTLNVKDIEIKSGIYDVSDTDIKLSGTWNKTGGTFEYRTSKLYSEGATIQGGDFYDLIVEANQSVTIGGNITVHNDIDIEDATSSFNADGKLIYIKGDFNNQALPANFSYDGGTIIFNGARQDISGEITFGNVILQGTSRKDFQSDASVTVEGDITILDGISVTLIDGSTLSGTGVFTMTGGAINIRGLENYPKDFAQYQITGGTFDYDGVVQNIGNFQYYNLHVDNGPKTLQGETNVSNQIRIFANDDDTQETKLDVNGQILNLGGSFSIDDTRSSMTNALIDWNSGTLRHYGGNWTMPNELTAYHHLILDGTGTKSTTVSITIGGDLEIKDGVTFNQGNSDNFYSVTGTAGGEIKLGENSRYNCYLSSSQYLFARDFGTYNLSKTSNTYIYSTISNASLLSDGSISYGNLSLRADGIVLLLSDLHVKGNFDERLTGFIADLNDAANDIYIGGNTYFTNYTPTSTVHLNGNDAEVTQSIDANSTSIIFNNIEFSGASPKNLTSDDYIINGDVTLRSDANVYLTRELRFKGAQWTAENGATFNSTNYLYVDATSDDQNLNFGDNHTIRRLVLSESATKTIACNLNIDNELSTTGGQVDFGSNSHNIAASIISLNASDITTDANFNFDGSTQQIPNNFSVKNLTLSNGGNKIISGNLTAYDITATDNAGLIPQGNPSTITVKGNWNFEFGRYSTKQAKVVFDGAGSDTEYTIFQNGSTRMFEVQFTGNNNNTYKLTDDLYTYTSVNIDENTTVDVNGHLLYIGARTDFEEYPSLTTDVEDLTINGELLISKGGRVQLNARDGDGTLAERPTVTVSNTGHLSVVGEEGLLSKLSAVDRGSDNHRLVVTVDGKISARFYEFRDLDHGGIEVKATAEVDDTNNFSEGVFAGMSRNNDLGTVDMIDRVYLYIEADVTNDIENVTFDYSGNPASATRLYNVRRQTASTAITFGGSTGVAGSIQGETYELDGGNLINWPAVNDRNWLGTKSTDWFDGDNWDGGIAPLSTTDNVIIASKTSATTFYPVISGSVKAVCGNLTIQGGRLTLDSDLGGTDITLEVGGDLQLESGLISFNDNELITVGENHSVANDGSFNAGNGTLRITKSSGTVVIDQNNSSFNNLEISNGATVSLQSTLKVEGDFVITNTGGITLPSNHNVTFNGDVLLDKTASFDTQSDGWIYLQGTSTQNLKNASFKRARFQGTEYIVEDSLIITSRAYLDKGTLKQKNEMSSYVFYNRVDIENDAFFFELYDGGGTHYLRDANWYAYGTTSNLTNPSNNGSSNFIFQEIEGNINIQGDKAFFDSVTLITNAMTLYADLDLFTLDASNANVITRDKQITGDYKGEFILGAGHTLDLEGADNFPKGFGNYTFDADSRTIYDGGMNQSIHTKEEVKDDADVLQYKLPIFYGHLFLEREGSVKTISTEGELIVKGNLRINQATFDTNNENVKISQNFQHNYQNSTLIYGTSKFTFDGDADQTITLSKTRENKFYDINVNKPSSTTLTISGSDVTIEGDLVVQKGNFSLGSNTATLNKNLLVNEGSLAETGSYYMKASGTGAIIKTNNSKFRGLRINGKNTTIYSLEDNITISDGYDLELEQGTLNTANATINIGNNGQFNVGSKGKYTFGDSGKLIMGNNSTLNVIGSIDVVGTTSTPAIIESSQTGYNYSFNVEGTISARYYNISGMSTNGIFIKNTATVDATNNFSDGTLTNYREGGVALKIENNQEFDAEFDGGGNYTGGAIENVNFIQSSLRGTANVAKESSTTGRVDFYNANGQLSGSNFERDPNNLINWYGPDVYTWTGAENNDWFNAVNWSSTNGGIPTSNDDVVIEPTTNQPVIDDTNIAYANNFTLKTASLLVLTSTDSDNDLEIHGNVELDGQLRMESENNGISFKGNWIVNPTGTFKHGGGQLTANGSGAQQIDNAGLDFGNLTIGGSSVSTLNLNGEEDVMGNFTIESGASLDLNASLKTLSIGGNVSVQGSIVTNSNTLKLVGDDDTDDAADVFTINIPSATNVLELLTIDTKDPLDEYQLSSNIYVSTSLDLLEGKLTGNGNTIYFQGDPTNKIEVSAGTFDLSGSTLVMNDGTLFELNGGSLLMTNRAKVTSANTSSSYSFSLLGGNFTGDTFTFEYMDEEGIVFNGVTLNTVSKPIDENKNPSDADTDFDVLLPFGIFQNGQANGRLINFIAFNYTGTAPSAGAALLENKFYSLFLNGPSGTNVRNSSSNTVYFSDTKGGIPGDAFEDEVVSNSIVWESTKDVYTWVGDESDSWTDPKNWDLNGLGEPAVYPGEIDDHGTLATVIIPIPSAGNSAPILLNTKEVTIFSLRVDPKAGMVIKSDTDPSGLDRSLDSNYEMIIKNDFSILASPVGKGFVDFVKSLVRVEGRIRNDGLFFPESSIMVLKPSSGDDIDLAAGENYNDLYIDGSNNPTINLTGNVNVLGLFSMDNGTLNVGGNTFTVKGDFDLAAGVVLNYEDDFTLVLDSADQTLKLNNHNLRSLTLKGTGTKTISGNLIVEGDFTIEGNGTTIDFGSSNLDLKGNWVNQFGNGNVSTTGTVTFSGTSIQTLSGFTGEETFANLIINNTVGVDSELDITITTGLTLTNGILKAPHVILEAGVGGSTGISSSATSYVYGKMTAKSIAPAFLSTEWYQFPVGSQSTWARAAINTVLVGATHDYTVEYTTEDRGENLLIADGGDGTAMEVSQFIWNITNGSSDADGISIRLYLEDLSPFTLAAESLRKLIHYYDKGDGIQWYEEETDNVFVTDGGSNYVEAKNIQKFSDFGASLEEYVDPADELPVELTYFDGSIDTEGNVLLEWETASEENASHFDIERSFNGKAYEKVGSIEAGGNSNVSIQYSFEDKIDNKLAFYRLKQVDFDGQYEYFGPVTLVNDNGEVNTEIELFAFPNPLEGDDAVVTISGLVANESFEGQITTLTGQSVYTVESEADANGISNLDLSISTWKTGVYILKIKSRSGKTVHLKLMK
ncbi:T9SS type A sorting domain-containing protein [Flammeovirga aprica]|nr:T9SS type A sorting domain-containing protein [Flammeovirga aprica]